MKYDRLLIRGPWAIDRLISFAAKRPEVDGIILGEPLCPHRSNLNEFQIIPLFEKARKMGLYISFQTPVYCTGRNFVNTVALVEHLVSLNLVDDARVQDMGVLQAIKEKISDKIRLIWSIYGYQREFPGMDIPFNADQLRFLISQGVDSFEITSAVAYSIYENRYQMDFPFQLYHYNLDPVSFSRTCYTENLVRKRCLLEDEPHRRPCDKRYYLSDEDGKGLKYVAEGHRILEIPDTSEFEELISSSQAYEALVVEGKTVEEIASVLDRLGAPKVSGNF